MTLKVLADAWNNQVQKRLVGEDDSSVDMNVEHVCDDCSGKLLAFRIVCEIRNYKREKLVKGGATPSLIQTPEQVDGLHGLDT